MTKLIFKYGFKFSNELYTRLLVIKFTITYTNDNLNLQLNSEVIYKRSQRGIPHALKQPPYQLQPEIQLLLQLDFKIKYNNI